MVVVKGLMDALELQFGLFALAAGGALTGAVLWVNRVADDVETRCRALVVESENSSRKATQELRMQVEQVRENAVRRDEMREMETRLTIRTDRQDAKLDRIENRVQEMGTLVAISKANNDLLQQVARKVNTHPDGRLDWQGRETG